MLAQLGEVNTVVRFLDCCDGNYDKFVGVSSSAIQGYKSGGFSFEALKLEKVREIAGAYKCSDESNFVKRKELIFELISQVDDVELRQSLQIDCLRRRYFLGEFLWRKFKDESDTPSVKRGVLNKMILALAETGFDVSNLPGFSEFTKNIFGFYHYPSKKQIFPANDEVVSVNGLAQAAPQNVVNLDTDSESADEAVDGKLETAKSNQNRL